ncbi:MAG: Histidine kinase [uncultured Sulfurovum sp.]|uniref:histidine kinase n=1 Tax=uncultured Sulfurovum sp. TaxID=269237 RepID=A0A6S6U1U3_9BACT|nr:MAG: Histidine kinase [uncultured Sulfurovum sp.]
MYSRPTLNEYVLARLITIVIIITILFMVMLVVVPEAYKNTYFYMLLFIASQVLLLLSVYYATKRVSKELKNVEDYLSESSGVVNPDASARFFTAEFESINIKLIQTLRIIKKREKEKRKYTAKIKLKNRQRSDMLSAIAHEFRNPIAAIMGYSQTLTEDEEIPMPLRLKFLGKIYNNGEKIEELLSRLLLWNRFESGEQKLQGSQFDIKPLAHEVATNLEDKYKNRKIIVKGNSLEVKADKALMEIVLKNLIENALKYSNETVTIKLLKNEVRIIDLGVGISEENIDKVTKKFFRTDEHSWDNSMGLGLAIVKQILKLHQTTLEINSVEDRGSTFSFKI